MQRPKVIFFDAVGTLFGVKGSVGEVYGNMAQRFGVEVSPTTLNQSFFQSFKAASPPIFPGVEPQKISKYEFEWWQAITLRTFQEVGVLNQFSDFSAFFTELYQHFATADPWFIYPDVLPTLKRWHQLGIELGVLSNFDSRLYSVLQALDLAQFFTSVTISTEVGAAKPDPQIFAVGLNKHNCPAQLAWHIGDSLKEDYQGAKAAGLRAVWLKRDE
ncbi:HAD family hydrolase [Chroococcidiopsis sp. CCMEE 29]|uniref:HAD-IA family hydrolase n=1 Tax=Chroococcidiopsis sp. CCMEE 29 TaxID=155894 RepID=UPI002021836E|nr:HAD family hydrolase [Chroococcidiopsis sp. CCMEE 29]